MKRPTMTRFFILLLPIFFLVACSSDDVTLAAEEVPDEPVASAMYFPPINSDEWETVSATELGWNEAALPDLLDYLETKNSKSFMILHNGKIVVEHYMNDHTEASPWYWASAAKTLTTAVCGIAAEENLININAKVSDYLGTGWTSAPLVKENLITCENLLTMTSGLDDSMGDGIAPEELQYVADAGTRWAYHGVFLKLQDVISNVSGMSWDNYFDAKLKSKIGMTGTWIPNGNTNVFWSNTRSMARFGLLTASGGTWNGTQIVPENYVNAAISTSQSLNQAYGYMWWLNGKESYRLPQSQFQFNGALIPEAPSDMYCALGKNDQKIYIVPSKNIVVIRMGNAADDSTFALSDFDNVLWEKITAFTN